MNNPEELPTIAEIPAEEDAEEETPQPIQTRHTREERRAHVHRLQ
jgi:hypothetical protein